MRSPGRLLGRLTLVPLLLACGTARLVAAADIWVSPNGVSCIVASCSCEKGTPCIISRVLLGQLAPGSRLKLLPGEYPGLLIENVHGLPEQKVVIQGVGKMADGTPAARVRGDLATARDAVELSRSSNIALENLHISHAARAGIRLNNSHHIEVRHSHLEANGVWGIFTNHANYFTAEANTIIGPAKQHGIYQSNSGDHVRIAGNYIVGFDGAAVHLNGDLIMGGAPSVAADGVISEVEIRDNFFAGNGSGGGSAINLDGAESVVIEDNILVGNKAAGIAVFKDDGAIGSRNIYAQRNLLVMAPESRWAVIFNNAGSGSRFSNNVIIAQDKRRGVYLVNNSARVMHSDAEIGVLPFTSDRNYFYSGGNFALLNDSERLEFRSWQRRGQDNASALLELSMPLESDPDFRLRLPDAVTEALKELGIAKKNPYRHLLGVEPE